MSRLLLLTPQLPYPPHQGTALRNYHIILGLSDRHRITLLSFKEPDQVGADGDIEPLLKLCHEVVTVDVPTRSTIRRLYQLLTTGKPDIAFRLQSPFMREALASQLRRNEFDIIQIEGLEMASLIDQVRDWRPLTKLVYDGHNAEAALQRRALFADIGSPRRWPAAAYSLTQINRIRRYEKRVCENVNMVTVVSDADRRALRTIIRSQIPPIEVVPNCIDVHQYYRSDHPSSCISSAPGLAGDRPRKFDVVFSGKMDYRPNVDAVLWFADAIWPRILSLKPAATWAIVGQKIHPRLKRVAALEGVTMTGRVKRIQPYLAGAGVYVLPFRMGSGTRLKLLEAMASGTAIVSTKVGAEGFDVTHGRELRFAESADAFASAVLQLLDHPEERARLGEAAVKFARQYDWRRVVGRFDEIYEKLLV